MERLYEFFLRTIGKSGASPKLKQPAVRGKQVRGPRASGIDRALQILDHLQSVMAPVGAYAIAKAIGAPLSSIYVIIEDLVEKQILQRRSDGLIWLGPRLYYYGLAYAQSLDLLDVATREMQDLREEVGETIQICGRDGNYMVVLAMAEGPGHFQVSSKVGSRVPLNWTASGRLLLGHLPDDQRLATFQKASKGSPTGRADTDANALASASAIAFRDRISIQINESDFSVACVASPICDAKGECVATISVVLPEHRIVQDRERYTQAVRAASERIETALGWR
jgi:DNA-binding IclR family transcriptional regulator